MNFREIETRRQAARIPQARLCERARVSPSTYCRWKAEECSPNMRTLARVDEALTALIAAGAEAAE